MTFASRSMVKRPLIAQLLGKLADEKTESISDQRAIYFSILEKFPGTHEAEIAAMRLAKLDQEKWESLVDPVEAATDSHIGRIFEFAFKDAISGEMVTSANFAAM